jgi:hypothetical protein
MFVSDFMNTVRLQVFKLELNAVASMNRVYVKMELPCSSQTLIPIHQTIWCHNSEALNMNHFLFGDYYPVGCGAV